MDFLKIFWIDWDKENIILLFLNSLVLTFCLDCRFLVFSSLFFPCFFLVWLFSPFYSFQTNPQKKAEDDILVRPELEALAKEFPHRFQLHYTLDRPPTEGWMYSTGFITKEMIERYCLFGHSPKQTQVLMCGPPPMIKFACVPNLEALGFTEHDWVIF